VAQVLEHKEEWRLHWDWWTESPQRKLSNPNKLTGIKVLYILVMFSLLYLSWSLSEKIIILFVIQTEICMIFSYLISFFLGSTGVWTQGLTLARQALYHYSHPAGPATFFFYSIIVSCFL
jgi:hypothetical protein